MLSKGKVNWINRQALCVDAMKAGVAGIGNWMHSSAEHFKCWSCQRCLRVSTVKTFEGLILSNILKNHCACWHCQMRCQVQLCENNVRAICVMYGSVLETLTKERGRSKPWSRGSSNWYFFTHLLKLLGVHKQGKSNTFFSIHPCVVHSRKKKHQIAASRGEAKVSPDTVRTGHLHDTGGFWPKFLELWTMWATVGVWSEGSGSNLSL